MIKMLELGRFDNELFDLIQEVVDQHKKEMYKAMDLGIEALVEEHSKIVSNHLQTIERLKQCNNHFDVIEGYAKKTERSLNRINKLKSEGE